MTETTQIAIVDIEPRLYYQTSDGHVHEIAWNPHWSSTDLTGATGSPSAVAGTAIACFGFGPNLLPRVYCQTEDGHVHEIAWNPHWSTTDITGATNAPLAVSETAIACFGLGANLDPRVYYQGTDGHLHEIAFNPGWSTTDITSAASAPSAVAGTAIACFGLGESRLPRVYFQSDDGHVHEIAWNPHWSTTDITGAIGAPPARAGTAIACFGLGANLDPRVYYQTDDGHVHELAYNAGWSTTDITTASNAPSAVAGTAIACFGLGESLLPRVYFQSDDGHVHEIAWNPHWSTTDITTAGGAPPAAPRTSIACMGKATKLADGSHITMDPRVYFRSSDGHMHEIAHAAAGWSTTDITGAITAPPAVAGRSIGGMGIAVNATIPTELTFNWPEKMFGSDATQATYSAQLTVTSSGSCTFCGQYANRGDVPIIPAPGQDYSVAAVIVGTNGVGYSFAQSGNSIPSAPQGGFDPTWKVTANSAAIAENWAAIAISHTAQASANNSVDFGSVVSAVESVVNELEQLVGFAIQVVPIIAG